MQFIVKDFILPFLLLFLSFHPCYAKQHPAQDIIQLIDAEVPCFLFLSGDKAVRIIPLIGNILPQAVSVLEGLRIGGGFDKPEEVGDAIKSFTILFYEGTPKNPKVSLNNKVILIEPGKAWDRLYSIAFKEAKRDGDIGGIPNYKAGENEYFLRDSRGKWLLLYEDKKLAVSFTQVVNGKRKSLNDHPSLPILLKKGIGEGFLLYFPYLDTGFWGELEDMRLILGGSINLLLLPK